MTSCRCPLCRLAAWVAQLVSVPVAPPVVPLALSLEEEIKGWPTAKIGEYLHLVATAELLPGVDRETKIEMFRRELQARAVAQAEESETPADVRQPTTH
jgi:hypothetical protein